MGHQQGPHENLAPVVMHKTDCIVLPTATNEYTLGTFAYLYLVHKIILPNFIILFCLVMFGGGASTWDLYKNLTLHIYKKISCVYQSRREKLEQACSR